MTVDTVKIITPPKNLEALFSSLSLKTFKYMSLPTHAKYIIEINAIKDILNLFSILLYVENCKPSLVSEGLSHINSL